MKVIRKSSPLNAVACGYLGRLLRAMPGMAAAMREMEPHQLAEFELSPETVANRQGLLSLLKERSAAPNPGHLWRNSELLDLQVGEGSPLSLALLRFVCVYTLHGGLQAMISDAGYQDRQRGRLPLLAALIGQPLDALRNYLNSPNWMSEVAFIWRDADAVLGIEINMELSLVERLLNQTLDNPVELIADVIEEMPPCELTLADYEHMDLGQLIPHTSLLPALVPNGWNALLWGRPGTGKTQLACLLAEMAEMTLYTLRSHDDDSSLRRHGSQSRLSELLLAQRLLARNGSCILLVDEGDDLLETGAISKNRRHQLLEQNPVPVIWTTNSVAAMDAACIRRFKWVQQFENPNPETRIRLFTKAVRGLGITQNQIAQWAELSWLSLADIQQVAGLMHELGVKRKEACEAIQHWLEQRQQAIGVDAADPLSLGDASELPTVAKAPYRMEGEFSVELLNLQGRDGLLKQDIGIDELLLSLQRGKEGRVLLHGMPGTGKTALVHYLASQIGCEVLQKQGSDLLHKYVGESEQSMAQAFAEASRGNKILFLDEVDSLLSDRRGHHQGWETSQVNELLQQIEHFPGILIVATNYLDHLDTAVARRFDYQIELCPLLPHQLVMALEGCVDKSVMRELKPALAGMGPVTLGDIAVIKRRQRLQGRKLKAAEIRSVLTKLVAGRERGNARPIGFVQGVAPTLIQG